MTDIEATIKGILEGLNHNIEPLIQEVQRATIRTLMDTIEEEGNEFEHIYEQKKLEGLEEADEFAEKAIECSRLVGVVCRIARKAFDCWDEDR